VRRRRERTTAHCRAARAGDAGDLTDEFHGDQHAAAAFGKQPRCDLGDEQRELALELVDLLGQLLFPRQVT
jgi:hypothetical protein